ncbi:MAG: rubredoxin [Bacillales bacterium]|jgi:rubredoxin|nr:rubredoxin [Bacillales bacterium]
MKYRCLICDYVYDEEIEGVPFADLPAEWTCPECGVGKENFVEE